MGKRVLASTALEDAWGIVVEPKDVSIAILDIVLEAIEIVSLERGERVTLNTAFTSILDMTIELLKERG